MQSDARHDILLYIAQTIHTTRRARADVTFLWVPAHIGVEGNGATKRDVVCMNVRYSKAEIKSVIKTELKKKRQELWDRGNKGRYYYRIQRKVGEMGKDNRSKNEDDISRMRFGHSGLNYT